jgi:hypothetical protein
MRKVVKSHRFIDAGPQLLLWVLSLLAPVFAASLTLFRYIGRVIYNFLEKK